MKKSDVPALLERLGFPFAYDHFAEGEGPDPPFLVYRYSKADNFAADGVAYFKQDVLHILMETTDANIVLLENAASETGKFALLFEFDGDVRKIRHVLYNCSASRPSISAKTNEENREVQTETLTVKARPLSTSYVKAKTGDSTKASAAIPRIYRLKFHRDIYKDLADLEKSVGENSENGSGLDMFSLEMFENIAYVMAKHAAPPLCRIAQRIGWTASTPSPSTKCCRSSLSCGG